ncbi:MAG: GAF domain-containing protein [Planctomycetes bacterium]|nr:GAF domain-containing protein [Planctomycetota bacterium]
MIRKKKPRTLDAVELLPRVIRRLLTVQDPEDMLPQVLDLCRNFLGADEVSLLVLEPRGKTLVEQAVVGPKLRPTLKSVRVGIDGITGWVAAKRRAQIVTDVRKDKRYVSVDARRRSEAAVPILSGDRLLGVLNFESNQSGYFRKTDLPLLGFLAAQIAIALRVGEARSREDGLRDRLAMLHHLSRLSGGFLPVDQFLARVAEVARRTLECSYVGIFQGDYDRQDVVLLAQSSDGPTDVKLGTVVRFGHGLIGKAFELGEIINAKDVTKEPGYVPTLRKARSEACIPIRVGDHCVGILDAQAKAVDAFSLDDMMVLETIARFLVPTVQRSKAAVG